MSGSIPLLIVTTLAQFVSIYSTVIVIYILLSWFPNVSILQQVSGFLSSIVDPYLNLFRSFIPPIGGTFDISPIVAIFALNFIGNALQTLVVSQPGLFNSF
jgi:YggT family protein